MEASSLHLHLTQSYVSFSPQLRHHFLQKSSLLCKAGLGDLPLCVYSSPSFHHTAWQLPISWSEPSASLRIWGEQGLGLPCSPLHSQLLPHSWYRVSSLYPQNLLYLRHFLKPQSHMECKCYQLCLSSADGHWLSFWFLALVFTRHACCDSA